MEIQMKHFSKLAFGAIVLSSLLLPEKNVEARDQISIVGSSTVFPFSASVAEEFGRGEFKTPVVESTGTGGGMKLFCSGIGLEHPDITNASRRIKPSEFKKCQANGVDMTEFIIGYDGIVMANANSAPQISLTLGEVFSAVAAVIPGPKSTDDSCDLISNPNTKWSDIRSSLPAVKIEVMGPPPTSGTRDAFAELAMEGGSKLFKCLSALKKADKTSWKAAVHGLREDGGWIDAGENDNLMVSKLNANPDAVGVFGYSFLDQNSDKIKGAIVEGVEPTFENIAAGKYTVSRSLFFYVKKAHIGVIPGLEGFAREFTSEDAYGEEGYLVDKGLIPLPSTERIKYSAVARNMPKLEM
jgi:phosphate transport system substrate-binding protein